MRVSMHCSDSRRLVSVTLLGWLRQFAFAAAAAAMMIAALPASAHKASDAYLKLGPAADGGTSLRIDVALRDLDAALDIDANLDGKLSWGEVKAAWPAIDDYVQRNVQLAGCTLDHPQPALERRADGVYAALLFSAPCRYAADSALRYTLLSDIDPTHRGLAAIDQPGAAAPVLRVLDPRQPVSLGDTKNASTSQAAEESSLQFIREGIHHIVTGYDHVLFLLALMLPAVMRRTKGGWVPVERLGEAVWPIVGIVTAFTVAHSITLTLAALRLISLPSSFIEPAIAVTIVLAALDNLWPIFGGRRALVTFLFGLIHGFGFAGVLAELDLPTLHFAWALFQFNIGLEMGQIVIVVIFTSILFLMRRRDLYAALVIRAGSYAAMLIGALWFIERTTDIPLLRL